MFKLCQCCDIRFENNGETNKKDIQSTSATDTQVDRQQLNLGS
jgi:hypothetical protein